MSGGGRPRGGGNQISPGSCQSKYLEGKCRAVSVSWAAGPLTCRVMAGQRGGGNQISPRVMSVGGPRG